MWPRRSYRFAGRYCSTAVFSSPVFSGLRDSSCRRPKRRWIGPPGAGLQAHGPRLALMAIVRQGWHLIVTIGPLRAYPPLKMA